MPRTRILETLEKADYEHQLYKSSMKTSEHVHLPARAEIYALEKERSTLSS